MSPNRLPAVIVVCLLALAGPAPRAHALPGTPAWFVANRMPDSLSLACCEYTYYTHYPNRAGSAIVFDSRRGRFLLLGGGTYLHLGPGANSIYVPAEILALDLAGSRRWEWSTPPGAHPLLAYTSAIYDSLADRVWLFGGARSNGAIYPSFVATSQLWSLDAASLTWTQVNPAGVVPPARMNHGAAFDPVRRELLIFGGTDSLNRALDDVWSYAVDAGTWTALSPVGDTQPARSQCLTAFDPDSGRLWIAAGVGATGSLADVWTLERALGDHWFSLPVPAGGLAGAATGLYDPRDRQLVGLCTHDTTALFTLSPGEAGAGWRYQPAWGSAPRPTARSEWTWDPVGRWVMGAGTAPLSSGAGLASFGLRLDPLPLRAVAVALDSVWFHQGVSYAAWHGAADGPLWAPLQFVFSSDRTADSVVARPFPDPLSVLQITHGLTLPGARAAYRVVWFDGRDRHVEGPWDFTAPPDPAYLDIVLDSIAVIRDVPTATFVVHGDSAQLLTPLVGEHRLDGGAWEALRRGYPAEDGSFTFAERSAYAGNTTYEYRITWGDGLPPRQSAVHALHTRPIPQFVRQEVGFDRVTLGWHVPPGTGVEAVVSMVYPNGAAPLDTLHDDDAGDLVFRDSSLALATDYVFQLGWRDYGEAQLGPTIPITTLGGTPVLVDTVVTAHSVRLDFRLSPRDGRRLRLLRYYPDNGELVAEQIPDSAGHVSILDAGLVADHTYIYLPEMLTGEGAIGNYDLITVHTRPDSSSPPPPDTTRITAATLAQPAPNPAAELTRFTCAVPAGQTGSLELFDLSGRRRWASLVEGGAARQIECDLRGLGPGLYLARLVAPGCDLRRRIIVIR